MNKLLAQDTIMNPALGSNLQGKSGVSFFQDLVPNVIGLAFVIGVLVFFFIMVIAAIQWITSGGDKQSLESARSKLTNAIIGFVILLLIFVILNVIQDFFGLSILSLDIGPLKI
jgi:hypothetical protein